MSEAVRAVFIDHQTGSELIPDDWNGGMPRLDDHYMIGDSSYVVVNVDPGQDWGATVSLLRMTAPDTKDTNPKDVVGIGKAPLSGIPAPFLHALGLAMMEGARKYGRHNYRTAGIRYSVYYDAFMRHMTLWWEGEDMDPDSGLPHPIKAAACLGILFDAMLRENGTDDRPPKSPDGWMDAMNEHAASLLKKFPDALPLHTEL